MLAGTGGNSTSEAIYLTQRAEKAGADGSLQVAPYYNKPTQEGLFQHFREVARRTRLPIVLYSIPGRCGIEIGVDTVKRLAQAVQEHRRHQGSGRQRGPREPVARGAGAPLRDPERR